jgi:hypothetical protein
MVAFFPDWATLFCGGFSFVRSFVRREEKRIQELFLRKAFRDEEGKLYTVTLSPEVVRL